MDTEAARWGVKIVFVKVWVFSMFTICIATTCTLAPSTRHCSHTYTKHTCSPDTEAARWGVKIVFVKVGYYKHKKNTKKTQKKLCNHSLTSTRTLTYVKIVFVEVAVLCYYKRISYQCSHHPLTHQSHMFISTGRRDSGQDCVLLKVASFMSQMHLVTMRSSSSKPHEIALTTSLALSFSVRSRSAAQPVLSRTFTSHSYPLFSPHHAQKLPGRRLTAHPCTTSLCTRLTTPSLHKIVTHTSHHTTPPLHKIVTHTSHYSTLTRNNYSLLLTA